MSFSGRTRARRGLIVGWPVAVSFFVIWVGSVAGFVHLAQRSAAVNAQVVIRRAVAEEQTERIATLEERLRILEAIEDLQTRLTPDEEVVLARHVYENSREYNIPPLLILAIIKVESSFGTHAVSAVGARGLMQVMPATGRWVVSQLGAEWPGDDRLFEPGFNVELGSRYFAELLAKFGSVEQAIIAYNWGETAVRRRLMDGRRLPESYLRRVQQAYHELKRRYGESPATTPLAQAPR